MNKEEAREFLEKYITVVGGMKAIADLANTGDENAKAFLEKYMNVVYAGKAITILAGTEEALEEDGGETYKEAPKCEICGTELVDGVCPNAENHPHNENPVEENTKESVVEPSGEPVEQ